MAVARTVVVKAVNAGLWSLQRSRSGSLQQAQTVRALSTITSPPSKAVVYEHHGPPDSVTRVIELSPVEVKENQVCVKMLAAPINPSDINRIEGVYPVRPQVPAVGGYEGVGEVYSVGSAVKGLSAGDLVIPSPPSSGDSIVQNGATSIVGQCVIQLARFRGIHSINIIRDRAGSEEVKERLKAFGADEVFTESQLEVKNVKGLLGGTMVTYGGMSKKPITVSTSSFIFKDLSLRGFWLQKWLSADKAKECRDMVDYLLCLAQEGKLKYEYVFVDDLTFHQLFNSHDGVGSV
ncbi:hypothetical protein SCA6_010083 [Theobroma cacao]